jgi:dGTPase
MNWNKLLSEMRVRELLGGEPSRGRTDDPRTPFERDYDRAVFSTPVRRLQDM